MYSHKLKYGFYIINKQDAQKSKVSPKKLKQNNNSMNWWWGEEGKAINIIEDHVKKQERDALNSQKDYDKLPKMLEKPAHKML